MGDKNMIIKKIAMAGVIIFAMTGCATLFQGKQQYVMPATLNDNHRGETTCLIKNEEGSWQTAAYNNTSILRDGNTMTVDCDNSTQHGQATAESSTQGWWVFLDFIMDACIVSGPVDGYNNTWFEYPDRVNVTMKDRTQQ